MRSERPVNVVEATLRSPALAVVTAYALRMSLLWTIHRDRDAHQYLFFPTSHETWNVAWAMALGNGFSSPLAGMHGPTAWVAPGYPPLLALGLKLFHMDVYAARIFGLALNCLVSALTCWPIYAIGKKVMNEKIGLASCWLWVLLPAATLFPLEWLWDQSFSAFFLALLLYTTLHLRETSSALPWVGYGLLWSAAVLMNPATGVLLPFLLLWLVQQRRKSFLTWRIPVSKAVLFFVLGLLPWMVRNYAAFGQIVPIKDNFGLEFWLGNNPSVKRNWSPERHPTGDRGEMQQLLHLGETAYMREKRQEAIGFIEAHPAIFLKSCFDRFVDTWTARGDVPYDRWVHALHADTEYVWMSTTFSLLAFAGLWAAWRNYRSEAVPLLIAILLFPVTYYISHSTLRYRHPIDPVMTVLAVYALACAYSAVSAHGAAQRASKTVPSPGSSLSS